MAIVRVRLAERGDGTAPMVQDYRALFAGVRRYLGLRLDLAAGGFVATGDTLPLDMSDPYFAEYVRHVRDGDLVPVDAASAALVGLPFADVVPADPQDDA